MEGPVILAGWKLGLLVGEIGPYCREAGAQLVMEGWGPNPYLTGQEKGDDPDHELLFLHVNKT